jgi:hypothetical protein
MTIHVLAITAALAMGIGFGVQQSSSGWDKSKTHYFCCDKTEQADETHDRGLGCDRITKSEAAKCEREVLECRSSWTWQKAKLPDVVTCYRPKK